METRLVTRNRWLIRVRFPVLFGIVFKFEGKVIKQSISILAPTKRVPRPSSSFCTPTGDRLKELGYDYPDVGIGEGAHHRLSAQLVKQHNLSIFQKDNMDKDFEIGKFAEMVEVEKLYRSFR